LAGEKVRLIPLHDYQPVGEWYAGLYREYDAYGNAVVWCDGCASVLDFTDGVEKEEKSAWITAHYDCAKEYEEVDDTLLDWIDKK
jgi:hypothetical protein